MVIQGLKVHMLHNDFWWYRRFISLQKRFLRVYNVVIESDEWDIDAGRHAGLMNIRRNEVDIVSCFTRVRLNTVNAIDDVPE